MARQPAACLPCLRFTWSSCPLAFLPLGLGMARWYEAGKAPSAGATQLVSLDQMLGFFGRWIAISSLVMAARKDSDQKTVMKRLGRFATVFAVERMRLAVVHNIRTQT